MSNIQIGTIVKDIIETTLPQSLIDKIKSNGCGCEKREEWLNNLTK